MSKPPHSQEKAPLSGDKAQRCPYCHDLLDQLIEAAQCSFCGTAQHIDCFREHGRCSVHACENRELRQGERLIPIEALAWSGAANDEAEEQRLDAVWEEERQQHNESVRLWTRASLLGLSLLFVAAVATGIFTPLGKVLVALLLVLGGLFWASRLVHKRAERKRARPAEGELSVKARARSVPLQTISFWHDILGHDGFDPITGMSPPPRLPMPEQNDQREPEDPAP